ncbi:MAG: hypothetical protein R3B99_12370 [Polyangiales bacterium]
MSSPKKHSGKAPDYRIPTGDGFWSKTAWQASAVLTGLGLLLSIFGFTQDPERFGYSYLFGLMTVLTFVFGGLFLVIALHFTAGHWGVTARRIAETIASGAVVAAVLAIPFFAGVGADKFNLYDEWMAGHGHDDHGADHGDHGDADHGDADHEHEADAHEGEEHGSLFGPSVAYAQHGDDHGDSHEAHVPHTPQMEAAHHHVLAHKAPYLNQGRWFVSAVVYFAIWILIGFFYFRTSLKQDGASKTESYALTNKMKKWSALSAILFGLTLTFAAFDWMMSLEPAWYSTIFGVIVFAGSAMSIFALLIVIGVSLYRRGLIGEALNTEHFHDLGKMMFGFMCFWAYVSFSQWMLIWYAGIPEESTWFQKRWDGAWKLWSLALMIGHFALPFYFLISRMVKRRLGMLQFGAIWLLVMHVADIYFFVLPQAGRFSFNHLDIGALLLCGGAFFTYVFRTLAKNPLIPMGDPRLARSIHHHQSH